jgi:hypothetical protein
LFSENAEYHFASVGKMVLLFLPHLPASKYHQECPHGYTADFLKVAPELPAICLALLAKFFGVFGLVAATLFAFVPEFLSHCVSP